MDNKEGAQGESMENTYETFDTRSVGMHSNQTIDQKANNQGSFDDYVSFYRMNGDMNSLDNDRLIGDR